MNETHLNNLSDTHLRLATADLDPFMEIQRILFICHI